MVALVAGAEGDLGATFEAVVFGFAGDTGVSVAFLRAAVGLVGEEVGVSAKRSTVFDLTAVEVTGLALVATFEGEDVTVGFAIAVLAEGRTADVAAVFEVAVLAEEEAGFVVVVEGSAGVGGVVVTRTNRSLEL